MHFYLSKHIMLINEIKKNKIPGEQCSKLLFTILKYVQNINFIEP